MKTKTIDYCSNCEFIRTCAHCFDYDFVDCNMNVRMYYDSYTVKDIVEHAKSYLAISEKRIKSIGEWKSFAIRYIPGQSTYSLNYFEKILEEILMASTEVSYIINDRYYTRTSTIYKTKYGDKYGDARLVIVHRKANKGSHIYELQWYLPDEQ